MKELLEICGALKNPGLVDCVMATVIHVEGSAYRRAGARLLISSNGKSWGMISGGCLEHDVLIHAQKTLKSGVALIVRYDSTSADDIVFGTGLGCNGIIEVFIEPITPTFRASFINAIESCQQTRQLGAIATVVRTDGNSHLLGEHAFLDSEGWLGSEMLTSRLTGLPETEETILLNAEKDSHKADVFIQPLLPPIQLVIFGGWLDVVPLVRMAREIGFQPIVVDPRQRQSSLDFFCDADVVLLGAPSEAVKQIQFDARTVAVLMNHNFEHDQESLAALAQLLPPFVGLLGPQRRKQKILDAVHQSGVVISEEFLQNLHGPVGLDIGAKTPEEIALSIMAEILAALNQRNAKPIRDRAMPLHASSSSPAYA